MMRKLSALGCLFALLLQAGCGAKYVTPGRPANLGDINRADIHELASRKPSPNFPARVALVRVQGQGYKSQTAEGIGRGAFTVITVQELFGDDEMRALHGWPEVAGVAPLNSLLLPPTLNSLDDLRVAAAKVQADVLLVYTLDTMFRLQGKVYAGLAVFSLGLVPDRDAKVTSTASALLIDVRTGFVYGLADATAHAEGLTNAWDTIDAVDQKRIEAERQAVRDLVGNLGDTWKGVVDQYAKPAHATR